MNRYITIDSGTTNTRLCLVEDKEIVKTLVFCVGATKSIGNKKLLAETIKSGIEKLILGNALCEKDIECIICSGMITSEFGLVNLPHILIPAGIKELQKTIHKCCLQDITSIPFVFIRGVKTNFESLENADVMRGEETEVIGIFKGEGIYVLPGSHTKIISVDKECRITDFKTTLTGELLFAIVNNTILKDAVELCDYGIDKKGLIDGYYYARENGINQALFKVRILKNYFDKTDAEVYNFYLGAILQSEIDYILTSKEKRIYIGGKKAIKNAIAFLLETLSDKEVEVISDMVVEKSLVNGMIKILKGEN